MLGAAVATRVGRALQGRRSTPDGSDRGRSSRTPRWRTRSRSRRSAHRPSGVRSVSSSASRSASSVRSSRGTRPLALICHKIGPALLAGCTVVLKSSPEAPGEGYVVAEVGGADRPAAGGAERHHRRPRGLGAARPRPRVDKITFTGSTAAGRRIASLCGERIARCTLELGGKSAAVILDDMDLGDRRHDPRPGRVRAHRSGVLLAHPDHRHARPPRRARRRAGRHLLARSGSATRSTSRPRWARSSSERQRDRVEGYIAKGVDEGATLVDRRRPSRRTSTGASTSSRPSSATSTTPRRSPARRSSGPCSA